MNSESDPNMIHPLPILGHQQHASIGKDKDKDMVGYGRTIKDKHGKVTRAKNGNVWKDMKYRT